MPAGFPVRKLLFALLLIAITYVAMAFALRAVGLENTHQYVERAGIWAPLVFMLLCAAGLIVAPLSGSSIYIVGGVLFGKTIAFFLSLVATLIGCNVNFWISRRFGRGVASRLMGRSSLEELDQFIHRIKRHHGVFYIALLMPLSQDMVSYAVGLTKVHYTDFVLAMLMITPVIVAFYVFLGTSLLEAII